MSAGGRRSQLPEPEAPERERKGKGLLGYEAVGRLEQSKDAGAPVLAVYFEASIGKGTEEGVRS